MSARNKTIAPDPVAEVTLQAFNFAGTAASWANDRLMPMIQALAALAEFSSDKPHKYVERLALIRSIAQETDFMINEVAAIFEGECSDLEQKLAALKGGAT